MVKEDVNLVLVPVDTKKVGTNGTQGLALKKRACPKSGASEKRQYWRDEGRVVYAFPCMKASRVFYLGVCTSIHYSNADTENFRRFLPSKILLK